MTLESVHAPLKLATVTTIDPHALGGGAAGHSQGDPATELIAYAVSSDPEVLVVPHFLSAAEAGHLIEEAERLWEPSFVQVNDNMRPQVSKDRTSYSCVFRSQTSTIRDIEARLAKLAAMPLECLEQLALVRYRPGEHFGQHHDGANRPKTVFVYLNDLAEEAAGETIFPELGIQVRPRRGCAVIWSNTLPNGESDLRLVHAGLAPKVGIKYGVNCFFHEKPLKIRGAIDGVDPLCGPIDVKIREEDEEKQPLQTVDSATFELDENPAPGQISLFTINLEPKLSIFPWFLSASEVDGLLAFNGKEDWTVEPAEERLLVAIQSRISSISGQPVPQGGFNITKCIGGVLPDGLYTTGNDEYCQRYGTRTVMIFLNEVEDDQSGELRFPRLGLQVRPRAGCAVMWSTAVNGQQDLRTAHQGRKIAYGAMHTAWCAFDRPIREESLGN